MDDTRLPKIASELAAFARNIAGTIETLQGPPESLLSGPAAVPFAGGKPLPLTKVSGNWLCLQGSYSVRGYQPDHQCSRVDNVTQVEDYLPDDVTNFTLDNIQYKQCSIDVTVNTSGTSSTHSLRCVAGVNFSMPSHTSIVTEWSLVCDKTGLTELTQTGFFGGQAVGAMLFSGLADRFGRRKVYVACAVATMASFVSLSFVHSYELFLGGRIVAGIFMAVLGCNGAYTMFMELLPHQWRCLSSVLDAIMWSSSCVFVATVAYFLQGVSWRYLCLAYSSVFLYSLLLLCILDESARWLLAAGRIEEAERILKKACRRKNGHDIEIEDIKELLQKQVSANGSFSAASAPVLCNDNDMTDTCEPSTEREGNEGFIKEGVTDTGNIDGGGSNEDRTVRTDQSDVFKRDVDAKDGNKASSNGRVTSEDEPPSAKYTVLDLFRHRVVLVPLLVCMFVWMTNNLFYYGVMLGSAKLSGNRFLNFGLLSLLQIPSTLLALFLMPRFNRRPLAFVYGMIEGSFLLTSVALVALGGGQGVTLTLATAAQYVGMFAVTGSYTLLFVYYMEVFPTTLRAVGAGTTASVIKVTDTGVPFLLVWAEETPWAPGVMVGCLCCLASASIWLLPETRHRKLPDTLEEIRAWKTKKLPAQKRAV
ncbi:solute carrier family 22 member 7-like [Babylonia areolata]|uniref:solute carrier family 22 member 7-like n=1 Tax=Babylonia areolata TaxID=304850 RepID=UPI003FD2F638